MNSGYTGGVTLEKVNELISKQAVHFDSDQRYMACKDLCDFIKNGNVPETTYEDIVTKVFIKHLSDKHPDVQNNSIKSLAEVISRLNLTLIQKVSETLIDIIVRAQTTNALRDVYVNCVLSIIRDISDESASALLPILEMSIKGIDEKRQSNDWKGEKELIEIITNLFQKRAKIFRGAAFDKKSLISKLLENITKQVNPDLRKKSSTAIGEITIVLHREEVGDIVKQLLGALIGANFKDYHRPNFIGQFCLIAINSITRNSAVKLTDHANQISEEIIGRMLQLKEQFQENTQVTYIVSDFLEEMLYILQNLVEGVSADSLNFENVKQIVNAASSTLLYNPNISSVETMEIEEEQEDYDDGYDEDDNGEDSSWKVRKASISVIDRVIELRLDVLPHVIENCIQVEGNNINLIMKLREENENVRNATLSAIQNLIKSCVIQESTTSENADNDDTGGNYTRTMIKSTFIQVNFDQIINKTLNEIKAILSKAEKQNIQSNVVVSCFKLIENVSRNMGRIIIESRDICNNIFPILLGVIKSSQNIDIVLLSLSTVRKLLKVRTEQTDLIYLPALLLQFLKQSISQVERSDTHNQVMAESIRLIGTALHSHFLLALGKDLEAIIKQIIPVIINLLKKTDIDQEIQLAVIRTTSALIKRHNSLIQTKEISDILAITADKIQTESKKLPILRLLKLLPYNLNLTETSSDKLQEIAGELANLLLKNSESRMGGEQREIKPLSIEALHTILSVLIFNKSPLDSKTVTLLANNSVNVISSNDIYLTESVLQVIQLLLESNKDNQSEYLKLGEKIKPLVFSKDNDSISSSILFDVIGLYITLGFWNSQDLISEFLKELKKDFVNSIARAIGSIVKADQQILQAQVDEFRTLAFQPVPATEEVKFNIKLLALSSIAHIGRFGLLKDITKDLIESLVRIIKDENEKSNEVQQYASIAIGMIGSGDFDTCEQILYPCVLESNYYQYYFLNGLQGIINELPADSSQLKSIVPFLFELTEKEAKENVIISECLGKIGHKNLSIVQEKLEEGLKSSNSRTRNTVVDSLKEVFAKNQQSDDLKDLAIKLFKLIDDPDIEDTRLSVLRILTSIVMNSPGLISQHINQEEFFHPLFQSLKFQKERVQQVDLGSFKHTIDNGEQLRKAGFDLLTTVLDQLYNRVIDSESEILDKTLELFNEDTSDEVRMQRIKVLVTVACNSKQKCIPLLDKFHPILLKDMARLKSTNTEKANQLKRELTRISMILQTFAVEDRHANYLKFYQIVINEAAYKPFIEELQQESVRK